MPTISRRDFLKATATVAALSMAARIGIAEQKTRLRLEATNVTVKRTACFICGQRCPLKVYVDDKGRIIKVVYNTIKEFDNHFGVCGRPQTIFEARYVPERIKKPLLREGSRGEGRFREISWDEALNILAEKLKQYRPEEILVFAHQGPNKGVLTDVFKYIVGTPNITKHCDTCHTGLDVGSWFVFGSLIGPGGFRPDYANADFIVLMGRNPVEGIVATPWSKSFSEARRRGTRLVVFDVRESRLTRLADRYYIVPPGTDLAIVLAIIHVILRDRLYNEDYLVKYTNAAMLIYTDTNEPVGLREHPEWKDKKTYMVYDADAGEPRWKTEASKPLVWWEGEINGRPVKTVLALLWDSVREYTPDWASRITGVPAKDIEWIARELATKAPRAFIDPGYKATRYRNDGMFCRAKHIVNALIGSIGARGGVAWPVKPKPPSPFKILGIKGRGPQGEPLYKYWEKQGYTFIHKKCYSQLAIRSILEERPNPIKMIVVINQNLVAHLQGSSRVVEALRKAEFVVVFDTTHNETTLYADLVIPLPLFFEEEGASIVTPSKVDIGQVTILERVVDPPIGVDARPGWWIAAELAKRIDPANAGKYEKLKDPMSIWASQAEKLGIDFNELMEKGVVVLKGEPKYHPLKGKYLSTVSGEIELISIAGLEKFRNHIGRESPLNPLLHWIPPKWMERRLGENEFVAVDVCDKMTATNMWIRFTRLSSSMLEWNRFDGVLLNRARAEKLGIHDGDLIRIIGPGGELVAKAIVSDHVHPYIIVGPHATNPGREAKITIKKMDGGVEEIKLFMNGGGRGINTNMLMAFEDLVAEEGARAMQCDVVVRVEKL